MPRYSFYAYTADGAADTSLTRDLDEDAAAERAVDLILMTHPRCVSVDVWCGPRHVSNYRRSGPAAHKPSPVSDEDRAAIR